MRRRFLPVMLAAGLGALASYAPVHAQQQPSWIRNRPAADFQALEQRRDQLSSQLRISQSALNEIFRRLGLPPSTPLHVALRRITEAATNAREFRDQARQLEDAFKDLNRSSVRDPALVALRAADTAFERGEIDQAAAQLDRLDRLDLTTFSDELQLRYFRARANLERLRGNSDAALALLDRGAQLADRQRWQIAVDRGEIRLQRARDTLNARGSEDGGHLEDLELAIAAFRDEALPLVPRQRDPLLWARTQRKLGSALIELSRGGPIPDTPDEAGTKRREALGAARVALDAAVSEERLRGEPVEWLLAWYERGEVYLAQAQNASDPALARIAVASFDLVIANVTGDQILKYWEPTWVSARGWRGSALLLIAEVTRDPTVIAALRADMNELLALLDSDPELSGNAEIHETPSAILSLAEALTPAE